MDKNLEPPASASESEIDEIEIKALIDCWAQAVREQNLPGIRADHDSAILMFDLPGPLYSQGLDVYMESWNGFFSWAEKPIAFAFQDVRVTAGAGVAFATAIGQCAGVDPKGLREELEFRLTLGLRKIGGAWRVMHEHHSLPAE